MVTAAQVFAAFNANAVLHYPFLEPGLGAWRYFCPLCGGGAMRLGSCDSCGEGDVEELEP